MINFLNDGCQFYLNVRNCMDLFFCIKSWFKLNLFVLNQTVWLIQIEINKHKCELVVIKLSRPRTRMENSTI